MDIAQFAVGHFLSAPTAGWRKHVDSARRLSCRRRAHPSWRRPLAASPSDATLHELTLNNRMFRCARASATANAYTRTTLGPLVPANGPLQHLPAVPIIANKFGSRHDEQRARYSGPMNSAAGRHQWPAHRLATRRALNPSADRARYSTPLRIHNTDRP